MITATAPVEAPSGPPPLAAARPAPSVPMAKPRAPRPAAPILAGTTAGRAGSERAPEAGSGDVTPGGGRKGAPQDYLARLAAWLERHKGYPRSAQRRGEEGTVLLRLAIDREGRVLGWRIVRGSGHATLDDEVGAMIRRAEPLPPMPPEMPQPRIELTVPIRFRLG